MCVYACAYAVERAEFHNLIKMDQSEYKSTFSCVPAASLQESSPKTIFKNRKGPLPLRFLKIVFGLLSCREAAGREDATIEIGETGRRWSLVDRILF